ncbi:9358_t:CDS:2 [Racocetra fulgida]|uniref:9358_t:CDS:1 n=1 Tax=Racocetra fulgida TaxID=60492 RepID=A0A9N8Z733_9GLOM|nr:9358_t:CDS:2 [Racocetra fulgida]
MSDFKVGDKLNTKMISENAKLEWSRQPPNVKNFFKVLAKEADRRHKQLFPNYKYQPKCKPKDNDSIAPNTDIIEQYFDIQRYYNDLKK